MAVNPTGHITEDGAPLGPLSRPVFVWAGVLGLAALAGSLAWAGTQEDGLRRFCHAYLLNYCFFLSLSLGALFFVILQHVTHAAWSVTVRRLAEILAGNLLFWTLPAVALVIPVTLGSNLLYPWVGGLEAPPGEALGGKQSWLTPGFFALRCAAYFTVWGLLARYFLSRSRRQDLSGDPALTLRMERFSGPALVLYGLTVTFAAFDLLMSLDPGWSSTIFGVYFFSGGVVGFLAALILVARGLQRAGRLKAAVTVEHYHDLGKLLFAFVFFWSYIAFSQYLLIWYGHLPEEAEWLEVRQTGSWMWVSVALLFGHCLIPFLGLLPRFAKRRLGLLTFWAVWALAAHWLDLYWLVMPSYSATGAPWPGLELALFVGLGGLYVAGLASLARESPLLPVRDPRLADSLAFENY